MLAIITMSFSMLLLTLFLRSKTAWAGFPATMMLFSALGLSMVPPSSMALSPLGVNLDLISVMLIILTSWITSLMLLSSQKTLVAKSNETPFMVLTISLMIILFIAFMSHSMIMFYVFFEASLIPTLLLILGWGYQPERMQAGMYLIMYTVTASLPLLLSLTLIFKASGHLSMIISNWMFPFNTNTSLVWWFLTILAFLVKTPLYTTHLWLPKAHVEAPVAGSMILAGILLKLGSYGLLRMATKFILLSKKISLPLVSVSLVGGVIASFICVRQTDVKALIAYSSVSHMGVATAGIMSNTTWGWHGAFMMLIAHGLCSSCLFSLANMSYETAQSRSMYVTKGLMTFFPTMTFWWFCFSACNMAAPPSLNLGAEILLIVGSLSISSATALPLALMSFMAAAYSLILYTATQHGAPPLFQNPLNLFHQRNYSICLLHLVPLILLISKMDLISMWT